MDYIAFLHKDSKSDFGVSFPGLLGCVDDRQAMGRSSQPFFIRRAMTEAEIVPHDRNIRPVYLRSEMKRYYTY